jgi:hypothetical protein
MATTSEPWYTGRYLELAFAIHTGVGFDPGPLADFLDAHCEPLEGGAAIDQRFHLGSARAFPARLASAVRDQGGSWRIDAPAARERWYLGANEVASFGLVQDVYCGLRRIAARRLKSAVLLHAAAVRYSEHTILILGDKGSGKSFVSYACMLAGAEYLASDKLCVWASAHGLRCAGLIGSIRLSLADAGRFAGFAAHRSVCERLQAASIDPARVIGDKICLDPSELCQLLGVQPLARARPSALVFLQQSEVPPALAPIDGGEAGRLLAGLTLADHGRGDPGIDASGPIVAGLVERLVQSSACHRLSGRPPASWLRAGLLAAL